MLVSLKVEIVYLDLGVLSPQPQNQVFSCAVTVTAEASVTAPKSRIVLEDTYTTLTPKNIRRSAPRHAQAHVHTHACMRHPPCSL